MAAHIYTKFDIVIHVYIFCAVNQTNNHKVQEFWPLKFLIKKNTHHLNSCNVSTNMPLKLSIKDFKRDNLTETCNDFPSYWDVPTCSYRDLSQCQEIWYDVMLNVLDYLT